MPCEHSWGPAGDAARALLGAGGRCRASVLRRLVDGTARASAKVTLLNCVWELVDPSTLGCFEKKRPRLREEGRKGFGR